VEPVDEAAAHASWGTSQYEPSKSAVNGDDLGRLRELTLLLDLAYIHHVKHVGGDKTLKSSEGTVRLEYGNFWYRKRNPPEGIAEPPLIEQVVVYSSVFSAARVNYFDSLDEAISVVQGWYEDAKAANAA